MTNTANLLLEAITPGPSVPPSVAQTPEGSDTPAWQFDRLVASLLGERGNTRDNIGQWAGQQVIAEQNDYEAEYQSGSAEVAALSNFLLGFAGVAQGLPETATPERIIDPSMVERAVREFELGVVSNPRTVHDDAATPERIADPPVGGSAVREFEPGAIPNRPVNSVDAEADSETVMQVRAVESELINRGVAPAGQPVTTASDGPLTSDKIPIDQPAKPDVPAEAGRIAWQRPTSESGPVAVDRGATVVADEQSAVPAARIQNGEVDAKPALASMVGDLLRNLAPVRHAIGERVVLRPTEHTSGAVRPADLGGWSEFASVQGASPAQPVILNLTGRDTAMPLRGEGFGQFQMPELRPPDSVDARSVGDRVTPELGWMPLSEVRLPGMNAVDAVQGSNGHLPPDHVIGARMIDQIVRSAKVQLTDGGGEMLLRLNPPHLGTVQMNVTATEGTVTATLLTSTESARQILQADVSELRQALADAGVRVDSINVSVGSGTSQSWNPQAGAHNEPTWDNSRGNGHNSPRVLGGESGPESATAARSNMSCVFDYLA